MGKGSRIRGFRRNNYCHKIRAKVGSHALTIIFVDRKTYVAHTRLKPGDRVTWREENTVNVPTHTGTVANETVPGGTLFISR